LFVQADVYAWRVHDEHALAAYWTGRSELARDVNERLLESGRVPAGDVPRIRENLAWAHRAIAERAKP
jgi:hypothetical protein